MTPEQLDTERRLLLEAFHSPNSSGLQRLEAAAALRALDEGAEMVPDDSEPQWAEVPHGDAWGRHEGRGREQ